MELVCDNREKHLIPYFPKYTYIKTETLTIGDYAITKDNQIMYLFERKTWIDLAASLKDGRYESQVNKLKTIKCFTFIIIEGKMRFKKDFIIGGIPFYKLEAAMRKLCIYGFRIIRTADMQHTSEFLIDFYKQCAKEECHTLEDKSTIKNKIEHSDEDIKRNILLAIPGIGTSLIPSINMSIKQFCMLSRLEISELTYENGKKVGKKAYTIVKTIDASYVDEQDITKVYSKPEDYINYVINKALPSKDSARILGAYPGISKKTAEFICDKIPFIKLIHMNEEDIAKIPKSYTQNIGKALAKKIIRFSNL